MNWLQLQQLDQQNVATAAAAAACDPTGSHTSKFAGFGGSSNSNAGRPFKAAPPAAPIQEIILDLNAHATRALVGNLQFVTETSGADATVGSSPKGLHLRLRGSPAQIENACACLRLMLL
jgi:hypothetical protein